MLRFVSAVVLVLSLLDPAPSQTLVQGGGDALQRALQSAGHGDVLVVFPGHYRGFRTGLGVTIVCQPGVTIWNIIGAAVWVDGLPAGRTFALVGGTTVASDFAVNIRVQDCRGTVVFDGVTSSAGRESSITSSDAVTFHACTLFSPAVVDSTVALADAACVPLGRSAGISAERSDVVVSGGSVHGANEWTAAFPAQPGISLTASSLVVAGDGSTTVAAGVGQPDPPAIVGDASSRTVVGPRVRVLSAARVPIAVGSLAVRETPAVSLSGWVGGQPQRLDTITEPGALVATFVDVVRAPIRTPFGILWVPPTAIIADYGTAPASGVRSILISGGVPLGVGVTLQAATLLGSGELVFGAPAIVVSH